MFYYSLPGNISFVSESAKTTQADLIPNPRHLTDNFHIVGGGQAPLSGRLLHPQVQDLKVRAHLKISDLDGSLHYTKKKPHPFNSYSLVFIIVAV